MLFQAPRGTADVLPEEQRYWRYFRSSAEEIARRFGYQRIDTPIFEDARLFIRGVGEATDIVEKETYTFEDRGGDEITLRPEGTAPVCRAYLEHGLHNLPQPVRLYYLGPYFRYERPQSGRYRQLNQFGIEVFGDGDASVDFEVIEVAWRFLELVGLRELSFSINSIGDSVCRPAYIEKLKEYYRARVDKICEDCKRRMERNPLRLLDCKQDRCQTVIAGAPRSVDYLCEACKQHWDELQAHLKSVGLGYEVNHRLVRGLDYYTRTVFEIAPLGGGSQSTIVGGGRYDGLIEELGGRPTPGIGYGMGVERVIENLKRQEVPVPDYLGAKLLIAYVGDGAKAEAVRLSSELRRAGSPAVLGPSGRALRRQLSYANSINATHALILGEDELVKGIVVLRDLVKGEQREISRDSLIEAVSKLDQPPL